MVLHGVAAVKLPHTNTGENVLIVTAGKVFVELPRFEGIMDATGIVMMIVTKDMMNAMKGMMMIGTETKITIHKIGESLRKQYKVFLIVMLVFFVQGCFFHHSGGRPCGDCHYPGGPGDDDDDDDRYERRDYGMFLNPEIEASPFNAKNRNGDFLQILSKKE